MSELPFTKGDVVTLRPDRAMGYVASISKRVGSKAVVEACFKRSHDREATVAVRWLHKTTGKPGKYSDYLFADALQAV